MADPLHDAAGASTLWTIVNTAENFPDVATPLGWSFWERPLELALRGAFCDLGALRRDEVRFSESVDERCSGVFFGRFTANLSTLLAFADKMPGTSGAAFEKQMFGAGSWNGKAVPRRYPVVAVKMPRTAFQVPKRLRAMRAEVDAWWRATTAPGVLDDPTAARTALREAMAHFERVMRPHTVATMLGQVGYEQVTKLCTGAGLPGLEIQLVTGDGVEETRIATDLWSLSRGRITLPEFLSKHGYHGPSEADVSWLSWREDSGPVERLAESYRSMPDASAPALALTAQRARRESAEAELFAKLSAPKRVAARRILSLARTFLPLRETGKAAFVQSIDGGRAACRALGLHLTAQGVLSSPDEVRFLRVDELLGSLPSDLPAVIAQRRARFTEYKGYRLPDVWTGEPTALPLEPDAESVVDETPISGIPVSPGIIEGIARVIRDPHSEDLDVDEILVCETTDPSWASFFVVAAAVVIDVGGPLSHGAIVARELGIPCVINTRTGTRQIRSGQRIRVDGNAGTVEVLGS
ncbi:MAG: PEP-utilizing enzyme [Sporichthyaceae bacterium]